MADMFEELASRVEAGMKRLRIPGVALGVCNQGREMTACFGQTSVEHPLAVTPDTLFQIGSITKTITATALVRLVERGVLDLDRPLREILPGFSMADSDVSRRATTRHLLTHTGGWVGDYFDDFGYGDDALARMVERIGTLEQVTPLGQIFSYNNTGFNLAGRVLEVLAARPYEAVVEELVLRPLGLGRTLFFPDDRLLTERVVVGHQTWGDEVRVARPWAIGRAGNPVGGAVSSLRDLLAHARFHLRGGVSDSGERLLRREAVVAMRSGGLDAGSRGKVGLSWFYRDAGGVEVCGHGGSTKGQQAVLRLVPDHDFAVALLTNSEAGGVLTDEVVDWALELRFGAQPVVPQPIPASPDQLAEYLGVYELPISVFEVTARSGGLTLREIPRGGFPTPTTPPGPPSPPMRAALCGRDRLVVLDEPRKGGLAEFFRGEDGQIRFCRIDSRVHRRVRSGG